MNSSHHTKDVKSHLEMSPPGWNKCVPLRPQVVSVQLKMKQLCLYPWRKNWKESWLLDQVSQMKFQLLTVATCLTTTLFHFPFLRCFSHLPNKWPTLDSWVSCCISLFPFLQPFPPLKGPQPIFPFLRGPPPSSVPSLCHYLRVPRELLRTESRKAPDQALEYL